VRLHGIIPFSLSDMETLLDVRPKNTYAERKRKSKQAAILGLPFPLSFIKTEEENEEEERKKSKMRMMTGVHGPLSPPQPSSPSPEKTNPEGFVCTRYIHSAKEEKEKRNEHAHTPLFVRVLSRCGWRVLCLLRSRPFSLFSSFFFLTTIT